MSDQVILRSARLRLSEFQMSDSEEVYACITPAITRYVFWELPTSLEAYKARREAVLRSGDADGFSFVVRRLADMECLGIASLDRRDDASPELGVWLKEAVHGNGYGGEAVRALADWASQVLGKDRFTYAVATENVPSRRIAEALGGRIIGTRSSPKYDSVVYEIRWGQSKG